MFYFTGIGTVVNMLLILAGGLIGLFFGRQFPEKLRRIVVQAAGLVVLYIGISGLVTAVVSVNSDHTTLNSNYTLIIVLCLLIGSVIGEVIDIERAMERGGSLLQRKLQAGAVAANSRFVEGFCSCTVIYCTGAMAIVGALNDALLADPTVLYSKGIIDGVTCIVFTASMGVGTLFSSISVGLYQGLFTLLAALLPPLTATVIAQMSGVGSLIIIGISLNLLELTKLRIGNMLPAIFLPLIWYAAQRIF